MADQPGGAAGGAESPTGAELEWRMKEYELMRAEIAARSSVHHSFMSWATLGAGGIVGLGVTQWGSRGAAVAWAVLLPAWICLTASIVFFEWLNTERLGLYAKLLENRINTAFSSPTSTLPPNLRGWENSLGKRTLARWTGAALSIPLPLAAGWPVNWHQAHLTVLGHPFSATFVHVVHAIMGIGCAAFYFLRWREMDRHYRAG